ncbi:PH domain-containing protein [Calditerricola satsumensis]|uniref:Bacterial Pleckstrin homology domain-containing protein n=1 Tax=Calditerricola satsumensis TaxID=373054 RepID=A0A8J3F9C6_9BACI|nr:PH domain-containing protein [Calditerricola satsumensis]GGJ92164.1 hypothetical protein GCM10007043_02310 [Calditerricola satsumensis]
MGLFDGLMGNAQEVDPAQAQKELAPILADDERIEKAYKVLRDAFVFTNKRLILIDKQGLTGRKTEYRSIPYRSITQFSVETAGFFDADAELKIWVSGQAEPITKEFKGSTNMHALQKTLATYVAK